MSPRTVTVGINDPLLQRVSLNKQRGAGIDYLSCVAVSVTLHVS